jgi:hypothetical protein
VLGQVLHLFREEHRRGELDGPLHQVFRDYRPWWELIVSERRTLPDLSSVRLDGRLRAVRNAKPSLFGRTAFRTHGGIRPRAAGRQRPRRHCPSGLLCLQQHLKRA